MTVQGVVKDPAGEMVIGASVVQQQTLNGTITDVNGRFSLTVPSNGTLTVSYIGYQTQHIAVKGQQQLTIVLKEDTEMLDEVVVVGYGTMKKSDLTGAVSSVRSKDIASTPVPSIGDALQGRAAGVQVLTNGKPGDNATIKVRGLGTINDSDPLIVIDGIPTDLGLNALNPNDIETVDVLKDASATAIYGARGANGVVIISTKRGKAGKGQLSLSANYAVQEATGMPKLLNASQYAALSNEMLSNAGMTTNPAWTDPSSLGKGTDWMDALIGSAPMQNYSLSYSGGSDKNTYYVSGSFFDQEGLVRNTGYRRFAFQFNGDAQVSQRLKFSNQLTVSHDIKHSGTYDIMSTMRALPTQPIYNEDGSWSGPEGNVEWVGGIRNPIGTTELNKNTTKGYNFLGNISAEITLLKELKFKTLVGADFKAWYTNSFTPKYNWKPIAVESSEKYQSSDHSLTLLWDNYFTFDKTFGAHKLNAMAGMSAQTNKYEYMNGKGDNFLRDENNQLSNANNIKELSGNTSEWALLSYMARANYSYADRYMLTVTARRDGSSRFGKNNRYGTFPSFSAAWRISEESWFAENRFLNDLKLRAGYGLTGNQNIGNYQYLPVYNTGVYNFNGNVVPTLVAHKMSNPNLKWESVEQYNIGVDLSLFRQRLLLSVDAYLKNTKDMLVAMAVPISTGYSDTDVPNINAGKMRNKGIEVSLNSQNLKGEWEWNTAVNLTFNKNEIVDLNSDAPIYMNTIEGSNVSINAIKHPMNAFYGFVANGLFQTDEEVENYAFQTYQTAAGDIRFRDLNNDGVIDDNDRTYIGNPNPWFIYSMNNTLAWKGLDFSIFLQGNVGNDIYNANRMTLEGMKVSDNQSTAVLNRWTGEGTGNSMPRAVYNDPNKNTRASSRYVENGSYLRIKNIQLGYTLPAKWLIRRGISTARLYLSCQNVATITGYSGVDPEVGLNGIDYGAYPLTRTYSMGLNISF